MPMNYIAGVTGPQYGMPMSGTPIGLPGPPTCPLGVPAGLQQHTIVNHTHRSSAGADQHVRVDVKEEPGYSYPTPVNHVRIVERTAAGGGCTTNPWRPPRRASGARAPARVKKETARPMCNRRALRASKQQSQFHHQQLVTMVR